MKMNTVRKALVLLLLAAIPAFSAQAQVVKTVDLEKYTKALVITHAYSNAIIDKVEEALKNGIVGNEDDNW